MLWIPKEDSEIMYCRTLVNLLRKRRIDSLYRVYRISSNTGRPLLVVAPPIEVASYLVTLLNKIFRKISFQK